ncbi:hypothetical protein HS041_18390 [Planomonospora sp. ID67723]|uniref:hypothetical protein n=1 Tax=Planomonospora sp. ID67723 TaxID=2738134 RepID=UPI0018C435B5|nr:hypothetical protein [Planomonospora sp. ID67723]MBG0829736.1 hypothetical protein [Planomonospora sp. ID67723]
MRVADKTLITGLIGVLGGPGPDRGGRERAPAFGMNPKTWASAALLVAAGCAAVFLAVWTVEAVAPVAEVQAVIAAGIDHGEADYDDEVPGDGPSLEGTPYDDEYITEAHTADGRIIDLGAPPGVRAKLAMGEPVVVALSSVTGRPVTVRTTEGDLSLHHSADRMVIVAVAGALIAAASWNRRRLRRVMSPVVSVALVVAVTGTGAVSLLPEPVRQAAGITPVDAMGIYGDARHFPRRVVRIGQEATWPGLTLRVDGPVTTGPPPGAPSWLDGFRVMVVPVSVTGSARTGHVRTLLIGAGQGRAELVDGPACGGLPGAFDGTTTGRSTAGPMCFAVPPRFEPRYLVIEEEDSVAVALTSVP